MTTKSTNNHIPKLRFPEFQNDGEWEVKRLGEIAEFYKGKGISKNDVSGKGEIPCVRYGELYTHYKEVIVETQSFTDIPIEELFLSKANDVIIPSSGETKEDISSASCVLKDNIALGGDINVIRGFNDGVFLSYYLNYAKKNDIAKIAQGVSIIHLYNEQLKNLQIYLPSIDEQHKIAECLSAFDILISATNVKLEQLKAYKKGLMQKLFPAKGKTLPEFRFVEFEKEGEWKVKRLEEIAINESSTLSLSKQDFCNSGYPVYGADGLIGLIPDYMQDEDYIAIIKDGSGYGKLFFYPAKTSVISTLTYVKSKDRQEYDLKWIYYMMQGINFNSYVKGSGIPHIYFTDYGKHLISVPPLVEQQCISESLSALDEMLSTTNGIFEQLKLYKKGMMQQMFPNSKL